MNLVRNAAVSNGDVLWGDKQDNFPPRDARHRHGRDPEHNLVLNEFLFALMLTRANVKTSPVGISEFTDVFGTEWGNLTATSTAIIASILVIRFDLRGGEVSVEDRKRTPRLA